MFLASTAVVRDSARFSCTYPIQGLQVYDPETKTLGMVDPSQKYCESTAMRIQK